MKTLRFILLVGLVNCSSTSSGPLQTDGGTSNPVSESKQGTCSFRVSGDTNDIVREHASFSFNGSTLNASCQRQSSTGSVSSITILGRLELKAYEGRKTYVLDKTQAFGSFGFDSNDGYSYSTIFSGPEGTEPSACRVEIVDGPDSPAAEEIHLEITCDMIWGYGKSVSQDKHHVSVSEGNWTAVPNF